MRRRPAPWTQTRASETRGRRMKALRPLHRGHRRGMAWSQSNRLDGDDVFDHDPGILDDNAINDQLEGFQAAGSAGGISPPAAHRTVRKPLDLHGSSQPLPCHLAMTVDAESDRSSRLPGWRPPSLSWVIRFAPRSLQALRHYYRMIRPRHAHRYFPPSCFALIRFSLRMA